MKKCLNLCTLCRPGTAAVLEWEVHRRLNKNMWVGSKESTVTLMLMSPCMRLMGMMLRIYSDFLYLFKSYLINVCTYCQYYIYIFLCILVYIV